MLRKINHTDRLQHYDNQIKHLDDENVELYSMIDENKQSINEIEEKRLKEAIYLYRDKDDRIEIRDEAIKYNYPPSLLQEVELYLSDEFNSDNITNEVIDRFRKMELYIATEKARKSKCRRIFEKIVEIFSSDEED